jgi:very-short-patch-repair endonuclease
MANEQARHLRKNATLAERILWARLRLLRPQGFHFRRQAPIGRYIVDFVCVREKLIIELDGSQHGERMARIYDEARTAYLNSRGYRVLRFWNADVLRNNVEVAEVIAAATKIDRAGQ